MHANDQKAHILEGHRGWPTRNRRFVRLLTRCLEKHALRFQREENGAVTQSAWTVTQVSESSLARIVERGARSYLSLNMSEAGNPEDALPIKKTSSAVYIGAGVGAVVIIGLVVALSGGEEAKNDKAVATEKAADAAQGMTKAELEERAAHIKKTQAALYAAEQEENAEAAQQKAAEDSKKAEAESQAQAAAPQPAASGGAPKPAASNVNKKKTMSSLDGLGADITSALK